MEVKMRNHITYGFITVYWITLLLIVYANVGECNYISCLLQSKSPTKNGRHSTNLFLMVFDILDELLLAMQFIQINYMVFVLKRNVLQLCNPWLHTFNGLHFCITTLLSMSLLTVVLNRFRWFDGVFMVCYSFQMHLITVVIITFTTRLRHFSRALDNAENVDVMGVALHRSFSGHFEEINNTYGRFILYVIVHSMSKLVLELDFLLLMDWSVPLKIAFLVSCTVTSLFNLMAICFVCHRVERSWRQFVSKLNDTCPGIALGAFPLRRQLTACNYYRINNAVLFTMMGHIGTYLLILIQFQKFSKMN